MTQFAGATILVTGAASGIGAATARLLKQQGAAIIAMDRDEAGLAALGVDRMIAGDVADAELWAAADLSGLSHAVINAGIANGGPAIADLPFAEWRRILAINLDGAFLSLSAAMRAIRDGGAGGGILISSSVAGVKAGSGIAPYATSKAALIHLAKVAAIEGAPDGIRVNAIAPAGVETPIWSSQSFFQQLAAKQGSDSAAYSALAGKSIPLGRFAKPEEVAGQIAFLLSDAAATITGTCLLADGGYAL
jgi:2-keto-3-deoxy-L-fuconate dehydrogenase